MKFKCKVITWGGITPGSSTDWGLIYRRAALQRRSLDPGGQQVVHVYLGGQEGQGCIRDVLGKALPSDKER